MSASRFGQALLDAWQARAVRFGFLGSVLLVIGSLSPAYLPQVSPLTRAMASLGVGGPIAKWSGTVVTMIGLALLFEFWLRIRPARRVAHGMPQLRHWAVLAIVGAPLLLAPPIFSHDAYSYAAQGWMQYNNVDPYLVGPGVLPGQFADQVAWVWRDTPAPYGPLALRMSHWLIIVAGFDPYWSAVIMRIPALLGVGMIGWVTPRIAGRFGVNPAAASWFVLTNPILIIDFIGGAHNDALMVGLMLMGIWVTCTYRTWWWGAAVVGVGAAIKQPALLAAAALPFLTTPGISWRPRGAWGSRMVARASRFWGSEAPATQPASATSQPSTVETGLRPVVKALGRSAISVAIAVGVFALLSWVTGLGFGWINAVDVPGKVDTVSPSTVLGHIIQYPVTALGWDPTGRAVIKVVRTIFTVISAVGIVWLAVRHLGRRPLQFVSWSFLLFAFCLPAIRSWYMLWGGVLFPMTRPSTRVLRAAIVVTAVLLGYAAMNFAIRNGAWMVAVLLIIVIWESTRAHELSQNWEAEGDQESLVRS